MATFLKANWKYVVGAILVLLLGYSCYQQGMEKARADQGFELLTQARDSLAASRDTVKQLDSLLGSTHAKVETLVVTRTKQILVADTSHRRADSFTVVAHLGGEDTMPACRSLRDALGARTTECAQLRTALTTDSQAISLGQQRLVQSQGTIAGLQTSLQGALDRLKVVQAPYQCKVLFFIPCLSRTTSFLVGAGAGITGVLVLKH